MKNLIKPENLFPSPKLTAREEWAIGQLTEDDPETAEAVAEWAKETALYGRSDGMDRQLLDRLEALYQKNLRFYEPDRGFDET